MLVFKAEGKIPEELTQGPGTRTINKLDQDVTLPHEAKFIP